MSRYKTFANGGRLYPGDLNAIQDWLDGRAATLESYMGQWRTLAQASSSIAFGSGVIPTDTYCLGTPFAFAGSAASDTNTNVHPHIFPIRPGDLCPAGKAIQFRISGTLQSGNNAAPGVAVRARLCTMRQDIGSSSGDGAKIHVNTVPLDYTIVSPLAIASTHTIESDRPSPYTGGSGAAALWTPATDGSADDFYMLAIAVMAATATHAYINATLALQYRIV